MLALISLIAGMVISYYIWRKEMSKSSLYYLLLCGAGILMVAWEYFAKGVLQLSGQPALMNKYFMLGFWIAAFVFFVVITVKAKSEKDVQAK